MKTKKIIKVLKTISKVCSNTDECTNCPFGTGTGSCTITTEYRNKALILPVDWDIKTLEKKFKYIERI